MLTGCCGSVILKQSICLKGEGVKVKTNKGESMPKFKWENGDEARSRTTGLKGIIVARADHLYGCNRYHLQPQITEDSKMPDGYWLDEDDIKIITPQKIKVKKPEKPGGFPSTIK